MKIKHMLILIIFLLFITVPNQVRAYQITVLGPSNEVILEKELQASNSDTVYDGLKKTGIKYENNPGIYGAFITSIGNISYEQAGGWCVFVNRTFINKSIDSWPLKDTDQVLFYTVNGHRYQEYPNYTFPKVTTNQNNSNLEIDSSSVQADKSIDVNSILSSMNIPDSNTEITQRLEEKSTDTNIIIPEENVVSFVEDRSTVETKDYKMFGYIGIIVVFILGISYIKFIRREQDEK